MAGGGDYVGSCMGEEPSSSSFGASGEVLPHANTNEVIT